MYKYFGCICENPSHHLLVFSEVGDGKYEKELSVEVHMNKNLPFLIRLKEAFRYIIGKDMGDYISILLSEKDRDSLVEHLKNHKY